MGKALGGPGASQAQTTDQSDIGGLKKLFSLQQGRFDVVTPGPVLFPSGANQGVKADSYLLSPINGAIEGLGKIFLFIGSKDILLADARKPKARAEASGIKINYYEYPDMLHMWMLLSFPESKKAKQQNVDII